MYHFKKIYLNTNLFGFEVYSVTEKNIKKYILKKKMIVNLCFFFNFSIKKKWLWINLILVLYTFNDKEFIDMYHFIPILFN